MTFSCFIPGCPKATQTGSIVRVGNRAFPIRRHSEWAAYLRLYLQNYAPKEPLEGALEARVTFVLPRPKSVSPSRVRPWVRPDLDNLEKSLWDSAEAARWFFSDAQICHKHVAKVYPRDEHEQIGVYLTIEEL